MSIPKEKADSSSSNSKDETILAEDQVRQAQLKMQFHGTRKGDHETIKSYVTKLQSIANSLAAINNPVSDQDLVLQLLAGLPSQYLLIKNTISSRFPLPEFPEACSMLYEYEKSLPEQQKTSTPPNQSAYFSVEMIRDIASTATALASMARDLCKAFGWSATPGNRGNKNNTKGRRNYKRGGGPSTNNSRNNSGRK